MKRKFVPLNSKGFTMIELIIVIILLGVLATVAVMSYQNLTQISRQRSAKAVVATIRTGLSVYRANNLAYGIPVYAPSTLDSSSAGQCSASNSCFGRVMSSGIVDSTWSKASSTQYTHNDGSSASATATCDYTSSAATQSTDATFACGNTYAD